MLICGCIAFRYLWPFNRLRKERGNQFEYFINNLGGLRSTHITSLIGVLFSPYVLGSISNIPTETKSTPVLILLLLSKNAPPKLRQIDVVSICVAALINSYNGSMAMVILISG